MSEELVFNPAIDCPVFEILLTAGDELPEPTMVLHNLPSPLTTEVIEMVLVRPSPNVALVVNATVDDADAGLVRFVLAPGDLVAGKSQQGTMFFAAVGGKRQTLFKFFLNIDSDPHP